MPIEYIYFRDRIIRISESSIPINSVVLYRGYGVFDYLRTYFGKPFCTKLHLNRFKESAEALDFEFLKSNLETNELESILDELVKINNLENAAFRLCLVAGPDFKIGQSDKEIFFILVEEIPNWPSQYYEQGIKIVTKPYERQWPNVKHIDYMVQVALQPVLKEKEAVELLFVSIVNGDRYATECSTSNFFIVDSKGTLITCDEENVLAGITRYKVLELAKNEGIQCLELSKVPMSDVEWAKESFITATSKGIVPVVQINNNLVGSGEVGPITKKLMALFRDYTQSGH